MRRTLIFGAVMLALAMPGGVVLGAAEDARPFHVLVANDDGVDAPGIAALVGALAADPNYRVTVIAPAKQQSVTGHGLVTRREVAVTRRAPLHGCPTWAVDATPASVVRVGLTALLANDPPDLVVSGINRGENDGRGAWTSGTVAAARDAALLGFPAVALSLRLDWSDPKPNFTAAARWAKPLVDAVRRDGLPEGVLLSVNIPMDTESIRGYRLCRMGLDPDAIGHYELIREEDGVLWYKSLWAPPLASQPGADTHAVRAGYVAIVPLGLDQTALFAFPVLQDLGLLEAPEEAVSVQAAAGG